MNVANDAVSATLKMGALASFVDGHDELALAHPGEMLHRA
jgi:hypothetical protein